MKTKTKVIICLALACAGTACFAACSSGNTPYEDMFEKGFGVRVYYDANGGYFQSLTNDISLIDVYSVEAAKTTGVKIIDPEDSRRTQAGGKTVVPINPDFFLAGWYQTREVMTDDDGNVLDVYGNVLQYKTDPETGEFEYEKDDDGELILDEEGNPVKIPLTDIGYTYSGKWDFENDTFRIGDDWEFNGDEYDLVLYAAWVPYFTFSFYIEDGDGNWTEWKETSASKTISIDPTKDNFSLSVPYWDDDNTGKMLYGYFPEVSGKTFESAYLDEDCTEPMTGPLTHDGIFNDPDNNIYYGVDYDTARAVDPVKKIYVKYMDGVWFHIHTAQQFSNNLNTNGNYIIYENLNFNGVSWGYTLASFSGKIYGNNHTFENITASVASSSATQGGLFGAIGSGALIENVTFKNVTVTISSIGRLGGSFGFFAGSISSDATITGVAIRGGLFNIYGTIPPQEQYDYTMGLFRGNYEQALGSNVQIDYENQIDCDLINTGYASTPWPYILTVYRDTGAIRLSANENDGTNAEKPPVVWKDTADESGSSD